jgi:hypothetical protein
MLHVWLMDEYEYESCLEVVVGASLHLTYNHNHSKYSAMQ